jgi:plasmid stability protein
VASLTLKNLPEGLLRALREAAERDRRSLTQQIIVLLESALRSGEQPAKASAEVDAQVAAWRELAGRWISEMDPAQEAEHIVERRTKGRRVDF